MGPDRPAAGLRTTPGAGRKLDGPTPRQRQGAGPETGIVTLEPMADPGDPVADANEVGTARAQERGVGRVARTTAGDGAESGVDPRDHLEETGGEVWH